MTHEAEATPSTQGGLQRGGGQSSKSTRRSLVRSRGRHAKSNGRGQQLDAALRGSAADERRRRRCVAFKTAATTEREHGGPLRRRGRLQRRDALALVERR